VNMPLMNGKEALQKIRQMDRYQNTPVVLFTTSSTDFDKNFAKRHNAGFVTKPLDNRQMKNITDRFIEHCTAEVQTRVRKSYN
jgi:CheY-like chemotaxis protein